MLPPVLAVLDFQHPYHAAIEMKMIVADPGPVVLAVCVRMRMLTRMRKGCETDMLSYHVIEREKERERERERERRSREENSKNIASERDAHGNNSVGVPKKIPALPASPSARVSMPVLAASAVPAGLRLAS